MDDCEPGTHARDGHHHEHPKAIEHPIAGMLAAAAELFSELAIAARQEADRAFREYERLSKELGETD